MLKRTLEDNWVEKLEDYKKSKKTQKEWCEENGMKIHQLGYLIEKYKKQKAKSKAAEDNKRKTIKQSFVNEPINENFQKKEVIKFIPIKASKKLCNQFKRAKKDKVVSAVNLEKLKATKEENFNVSILSIKIEIPNSSSSEKIKELIEMMVSKC